MKILIVSVGKKHDPAVAQAIADFTERIGRYAPVEWKLLSPVAGSGSAPDTEAEGRSILGALDDRDFAILLDETGKELSSPELAALIEKRLNASTHRLTFIIGGAYGVSAPVRERASGSNGAIIALSKLTFPHQLVRLILAEQIYRAFTILKGEKYHHA